jgi:hypothetical protein
MSVNYQYPVLLMPVKVETRFVRTLLNKENQEKEKKKEKEELWIRVFPDKIFLDSFHPTLSQEECLDKKQFHNIVDDKEKTEVDVKEFWQLLVKKYGVYRASWIVDAPEVDSCEQLPKAEAFQQEFLYRWLPEYFKAYIYGEGKNGEFTLEAQFKSIVKKEANQIKLADLSIFDEEEDWLTDFEVAIEKGVAYKYKFENAPVKRINKVIVFGVRPVSANIGDKNVSPSMELVEELLNAHKYFDGFSFLKYGTPTNNLKHSKSGYSSDEQYDAEGSYEYIFREKKPAITKASSGDGEANEYQELVEDYATIFSRNLSYKPEDFDNIKNADQKEPLLNHLIQKATWFALGGKTLNALCGDLIDNEAHQGLWEFYSKYVKARGIYPAIKIGDLPYGVLPVTHIKSIFDVDNIRSEGTPQQQRQYILAKLFECWLEMANDRTNLTNYVPRMPGSKARDEELAKILSMQPISSYFQVRRLEMEPMKNALTRRLENKEVVQVPQRLFSYPPKLVHELITESNQDPDPGYNRNLDYAEAAFQDLSLSFNLLFSKNIKTEKKEETVNFEHLIRYAHMLTFKSAGIASNEDLNIRYTSEHDEWLKDFRQLAEKRKKLLQDPSKEEWENVKTTYKYGYKGETDFLLFDLLNESYAMARQLHNRVIYFTPTKEEVDGFTEHRVHLKDNNLLGKSVNKNDTILELIPIIDNDPIEEKKITITAPFSGKITYVFVEENETLGDDKRLFRLKDEEAFENITKQMASLQIQIVDEIERIKNSGEDHIKAQKQAILEVLDLNAFRLDAWLTGLAQEKLDQIREKDIQGFFFGAYGWVESHEDDFVNSSALVIDEAVEENAKEATTTAKGGIIHTPNVDQAITAALFRQSFSKYKEDVKKVNPYTINLTSDRVEKALKFFEGIRQGQEIEALLGYRLERFLHEKDKDDLILSLREDYPLHINIADRSTKREGVPNLTVINGLDFIKVYRATGFEFDNDKTTLKEGGELIEDILDGGADLLLFESAHQVINGNFSQAAAAMDAAKGKIEPPRIESIRTRLKGTTQSHKLAIFFDAPPNPPLDPSQNPRAFINPVLEHWLQTQIGDLNQFACKVSVFQTTDSNTEKLGEVIVGLDELDLGYLDLLHTAYEPVKQGQSEIENRIYQKGLEKLPNVEWSDQLQFRIGPPSGTEYEDINDAIEYLRYIRRMVLHSRPFNINDLLIGQDADSTDADAALQKLKTAVGELRKKITLSIRFLIIPNADLDAISKFNLGYPSQTTPKSNTPVDESAIRSKARALAMECFKLQQESQADSMEEEIELFEKIIKKLFGKDFRMVFPSIISPSFETGWNADQKAYVADESTVLDKISGGQERIRHWLEGRAAVSPEAASFSDWLMVTESIGDQTNNWQLKIAQFTDGGLFPWLALSGAEIETVKKSGLIPPSMEAPVAEGKIYPDAGESVVIYAPQRASVDSNDLVFGLMIEEFSEMIPDKTIDTGVAFEYNAPNNEAPQAILIAVPSFLSSGNDEWTEERLLNLINDTIDLTKVRMVDSDALQKFGSALPMAHWLNIPNTL